MIIQLLFGTMGSLGFGMLFNSNKNKLLYISIGGFLNILAYLIMFRYTNSVFLSSTICAFVTSIYSDIMARLTKCPSTIYILTGLVPSVPGASIFYMMQNIVLGNKTIAINKGIESCQIIIGIVFGITIASVILTIYKQRKTKN